MQVAPPLQRPLLRHLANLLATLLGLLLLALAAAFQPALLKTLLYGALPVYLGILLPQLVGRGERLQRIRAARQASLERWGFCSRDRPGPWLNYIDYPLTLDCSELRGRFFYSEWLLIHDGRIVINPGEAHVDLARNEVSYRFDRPRTYAWDGCSPKIPFYWLALVGTPDWWEHGERVQRIRDGALQEHRVFWPLAHHASLVHDALYQFLNVAPVRKEQADRLFHRLLLASGMPRPLAWLYRLAVVHGGARETRGLDNPDSPLRCLTPIPGSTAPPQPASAVAEAQVLL